MPTLLLALGVLLAGAAGTLALAAVPRWGARVGVGGAIAGCALGLVAAVRVLLGTPAAPLHLAWSVPYGAFALALDPLSAFFLVPIFALSGLAALYGAEYLGGRGDVRATVSWLFFDVLVASMAAVVVARNAVLFLVAWEVMALASFFLVTLDDEDERVRRAGWTYLVATHLGSAFVLVLLLLLGGGGSLDFDRVAPAAGPGLLVALGLVGFGAKAGLVPLHVWLPEAHPAAPSHVSAVMSGVMIKTGVYALLRTLTLVGPVPGWTGPLLVCLGAGSGVLGAVFALAQRDVKRMLAYSSVENVGIVVLGLGLGLVGRAAGAPGLAALGVAGALLHVLNHALFKGLLFLGAGAVVHATGTRDMERLGGLYRRMPTVGAATLVGAASLAALPPLGGFASELLLALGAAEAAASLAPAAAVPALVALGALAVIGALGAAGVARTFGVVFLGTPRTPAAGHAHEPGLAMRLPLVLLAAACAGLGLAAPWLLAALAPVVTPLAGLDAAPALAPAAATLRAVAVVEAVLLALVAGAAGARRALLARRTVAVAPVWGCGWAAPTARMQYGATSFAEPLLRTFRTLLVVRRRIAAPGGPFPAAASFGTEAPDPYRLRVWDPAFRGVRRGLARLRWLQHGEVQLYVLYIAATLVVLLAWTVGRP
ncbi:MAG TPA: proton-conducting transporter membrane subunit [Candidatus Binatia bacterium]|nr:proton-conducting transporter membrane subunit [Candidatus Binatia bacterium]